MKTIKSAEEIAKDWDIYFTREGEPQPDVISAMEEYKNQSEDKPLLLWLEGKKKEAFKFWDYHRKFNRNEKALINEGRYEAFEEVKQKIESL